MDGKTDWIIRLTAEIERLRRELSYRVHTDEDIKVQNAEIERLSTENQILRAENHQLRATLAKLHELASQR